MEELFKYAVEGGSFGVSLFLVYVLSKKFIKKEIIEPIQDLKEENTEIRKSFLHFTENINNFVLRILKSNADTHDSINKNLTNMNTLFTEATRHTSQSKLDAYDAVKRVNVLEQSTDKLLKIATLVHEQNKDLRTEVHKINNDLILIKSKVNTKNED